MYIYSKVEYESWVEKDDKKKGIERWVLGVGFFSIG